MINTIKLLRKTADDCERRARNTSDRATQAELFDISAKWHLLAREVANLHEIANQLEDS